MLPANLDQGTVYVVSYLAAIGLILLTFNSGLSLLVMCVAAILTAIVGAFSYKRRPLGRWWAAPLLTATVTVGTLLGLLAYIASRI